MSQQVLEKIIGDVVKNDLKLLIEMISQKLNISNKEELGIVFHTVLGYIALIPSLMEQISLSNIGQQLTISSSPLMQAIENYYHDKEDILPDSSYPDARSLIDDTYYALTLLQLVQMTFPKQNLLQGIDLNYGRWLMGNILGGKLATLIENRANSDLQKLTTQQQSMMQKQLNTLNLKNVNHSMNVIAPPSASTSPIYNNDTNWYNYQTSSYSAEDQFEADSAGWPGGAYDNPDSSYYSYDDNY